MVVTQILLLEELKFNMMNQGLNMINHSLNMINYGLNMINHCLNMINHSLNMINHGLNINLVVLRLGVANAFYNPTYN